MKYIFIEKHTYEKDVDGKEFSIFTGKCNMYEQHKGKRKFIGEVELSKETKRDYIIAYICQKVAEGGVLQDECADGYGIRPAEFFMLIKQNKEWDLWFREANAIRAKIILEETFKSLKGTEKKDELMKLLKEIMLHIRSQKKEDDGITQVSFYGWKRAKKRAKNT